MFRLLFEVDWGNPPRQGLAFIGVYLPYSLHTSTGLSKLPLTQPSFFLLVMFAGGPRNQLWARKEKRYVEMGK